MDAALPRLFGRFARKGVINIGDSLARRSFYVSRGVGPEIVTI